MISQLRSVLLALSVASASFPVLASPAAQAVAPVLQWRDASGALVEGRSPGSFYQNAEGEIVEVDRAYEVRASQGSARIDPVSGVPRPAEPGDGGGKVLYREKYYLPEGRAFARLPAAALGKGAFLVELRLGLLNDGPGASRARFSVCGAELELRGLEGGGAELVALVADASGEREALPLNVFVGPGDATGEALSPPVVLEIDPASGDWGLFLGPRELAAGLPLAPEEASAALEAEVSGEAAYAIVGGLRLYRERPAYERDKLPGAELIDHAAWDEAFRQAAEAARREAAGRQPPPAEEPHNRKETP